MKSFGSKSPHNKLRTIGLTIQKSTSQNLYDSYPIVRLCATISDEDGI